MNKAIYAVLDTKAHDINSLMLFPNDAAATRAFSEMLRGSEFMKQYASDFTLIRLGTLVLELEDGPKHPPAINLAVTREVITARQILDSQEASK